MQPGGQPVCLSICLLVLARPPGRKEPYGFVFRQPVRGVQAADLRRNLLTVAWLGNANGCEVLGKEEARYLTGGRICLAEGKRPATGPQQLTSGVMRLMVGRS